MFPTFPSKSKGIVRAISVSAITETYKKFAVMTQRDPEGYASHSGRIGSFSDATAVSDECLGVAKSLGWASDRVPKRVYKRKSQSEARATGLALAQSIAVAAQRRPGCKESVPGASSPAASTVNKHSAPGQSQGASLLGGGASAGSPGSSSTAPVDRLKDLGFKPFPLKWKEVDGQSVCVRYQLGCCRRPQCPHAHVCHACGKRHPDGRLCKSAIRAASSWKPT